MTEEDFQEWQPVKQMFMEGFKALAERDMLENPLSTWIVPEDIEGYMSHRGESLGLALTVIQFLIRLNDFHAHEGYEEAPSGVIVAYLAIIGSSGQAEWLAKWMIMDLHNQCFRPQEVLQRGLNWDK